MNWSVVILCQEGPKEENLLPTLRLKDSPRTCDDGVALGQDWLAGLGRIILSFAWFPAIWFILLGRIRP